MLSIGSVGCGQAPPATAPNNPEAPVMAARPETTALEALAHARRFAGSLPLVRISAETVDIPMSGRIPVTGTWFVTFATADPAKVVQWRIKGDGSTSSVQLPSGCFGIKSGDAPIPIDPAIDSDAAIALSRPAFLDGYGDPASAVSTFYVNYHNDPYSRLGVVELRLDASMRRRCPIDKVQLDEKTGGLYLIQLYCTQSPNMGHVPDHTCRGT